MTPALEQLQADVTRNGRALAELAVTLAELQRLLAPCTTTTATTEASK